MVLLFIEHKGSDSTVLRGAAPHLGTNMDGGLSNPKLVDRARDDARRSSVAIIKHESG